MPAFLPENNLSLPSDSEQRSLWKIVDLLGGGPGTGGISALSLQQVYEGRAPAAPDNPTKEALDFPIGGGPIQQWSVSLQQWV